jgi:DDE superfamily endonuclease
VQNRGRRERQDASAKQFKSGSAILSNNFLTSDFTQPEWVGPPRAALGQIREAVERGIPAGVVLAGAAYGTDTRFREQAYGFLVAERSRFSPSARAGKVDLPVSPMPTKFRPRGRAAFASSGIIPGRLSRSDKPLRVSFFGNFPVVLFVELCIYNTVVLRSRVSICCSKAGLSTTPA